MTGALIPPDFLKRASQKPEALGIAVATVVLFALVGFLAGRENKSDFYGYKPTGSMELDNPDQTTSSNDLDR